MLRPDNARRLLLASLMLSAALAAPGCDRGDESGNSPTPGASAPAAPAPASPATVASRPPKAPLPEDLILDKAPEESQDVAALKGKAKAGDEVVVRGIVGGDVKPIAENYASFFLLDPGVQTCDKQAGDSCETPWDACCEPKSDLLAKMATIQVSGPDGRPLKEGLHGVGGIAPLKEVTVVGTVREGGEKNLVIDAKKIFVKG